jgi:hypothetical protein
MSELRECPYVKKYLALEWMSDTQPMPDGSKVFATKEECLAFVQGHPHFKEFPDVRWTIVTVYDTSPTESTLRKRVGELEAEIRNLAQEWQYAEIYARERSEAAMRAIEPASAPSMTGRWGNEYRK